MKTSIQNLLKCVVKMYSCAGRCVTTRLHHMTFYCGQALPGGQVHLPRSLELLDTTTQIAIQALIRSIQLTLLTQLQDER
jgi:hypothetical protein